VNRCRTCAGVQIFIEADPKFAQVLTAAIEPQGSRRYCRVRPLEFAPDPAGWDAKVLFGLPVRFRYNYFPECRANPGKVILLIQPAASSMCIPFMLNQGRARHKLEHLIL
jgi:hypothetical protein